MEKPQAYGAPDGRIYPVASLSKKQIKEFWKPIESYEGFYEVSDRGRVRSICRYVKDRWGTKKLFKPGIILQGEEDKDGYKRVRLSKKGKSKKYLVHRLMARSFLKNEEQKPLVLHKDGNNKNNKISNLKWGTARENMHDSIKHGTARCLRQNGMMNSRARLNIYQVRVIKHLKNMEPKMNQREVGAVFSVCADTIGGIWRDERWSHINL